MLGRKVLVSMSYIEEGIMSRGGREVGSMPSSRACVGVRCIYVRTRDSHDLWNNTSYAGIIVCQKYTTEPEGAPESGVRTLTGYTHTDANAKQRTVYGGPVILHRRSISPLYIVHANSMPPQSRVWNERVIVMVLKIYERADRVIGQ